MDAVKLLCLQSNGGECGCYYECDDNEFGAAINCSRKGLDSVKLHGLHWEGGDCGYYECDDYKRCGEAENR